MSVLSLQDGIIYGPIDSRRLGKSLGINLLPTGYKLCPFNCVYCHYGWTDKYWRRSGKENFPGVDEVKDALKRELEYARECGLTIDYITFSGNGEPTTHPQFARMVEMVWVLRNGLFPSARIALLSNSALVGSGHIREAIGRVELPIMKLDVGSQGLLEKVNQPVRGTDFEEIVSGLAMIPNIAVQALFLAGRVDNSTPQAVADWQGALERIKPKEVQIYTTDRPTAEGGIVAVPDERLEEIALQTAELLGVEVRVY